MKMGQTECFETLAFKIQTQVNHPEESVQDNSIIYEARKNYSLNVT
jgi:hypothetical protein